MAGDRRQIDTGTFANDLTSFACADDVLTLLVHLGYLGYDSINHEVFMPNREVLQEFVTVTRVCRWDEILRSVDESEKLLRLTWDGDEKAVAEGVEKAHLETSHLQYNDEKTKNHRCKIEKIKIGKKPEKMLEEK